VDALQADATIKMGLRFRRKDSQILRFYEERVRNGDYPGDVTTFEQAALAAETGEPLVVHCVEELEVFLMAEGYAALGCRPSVEELNS
jgi:hypothetical protein